MQKSGDLGELMLDNNVLNFLQKDDRAKDAAESANFDYVVTITQDNEFYQEEHEPPEEQLQRIKITQDDIIGEVIEPDTIGYGDAYGYSYGGITGDLVEKLVEPHDTIGEVERKDAIGAEAAVTLGIRFVTRDRGLQEKMRYNGLEPYLMTLTEFKKLIGYSRFDE